MPLAAPDLDAAFEACRRETAEWAKTFYIGTLLLPPEKRRAIWAIYVWCRRTDELMDSPEAQARPVEELAERLDGWEEKTRALFNGHVADDLDAVMVDTLERFPHRTLRVPEHAVRPGTLEVRVRVCLVVLVVATRTSGPRSKGSER